MNFLSCTVILALCTLLSSGAAQAQLTSFPPTLSGPQAKSQDELDDYGIVFESAESGNPKKTVALAGKFLEKYPQSEFCPYVLMHEMYAYEALNDYAGVVRTARAALRLSPKSATVLATLAHALAEHASPGVPDQDRLLAEAESDATEAEKLIDEQTRPRSVSREQFEKYKRETKRDIFATLGLVALRREDFAGAIDLYTKAIAVSPEPQGVDYYRLGLAYLSAHREAAAIRMLAQAGRLGPPVITTLAEKLIHELKKRQVRGGPTRKIDRS